MISKKYLCAAIVAAIVLADVTVPVMAQSLEEIVVTARRKSESLQDVPASVTVFTSATLANAGVERADDFIQLTPGVTIVNTASVGDVQVNIRGINGARDAETSFALVIDGVLYTNPSALNREYPDLAQIEILKGPQGAIYGRNAAAGAIVIATEDPGDETAGSMKAALAENNTFTGAAQVGGALIDDKLFFKVGADFRDTDGFYNNRLTGVSDVENFTGYNVNGRLVWTPDDVTRIDVKARYGEVDAAGLAFNVAFALPGFVGLLGPAVNEDVNAHKFLYQPNIVSENEQSSREFSIKLDRAFNAVELTAWLLYSDVEQWLSADGTSGAFGFFGSTPFCRQSILDLEAAGVTLPAPQILTYVAGSGTPGFHGPYTPTGCDGTQFQVRNQEDISVEARLASTNNGPLQWSAGVYFLTFEREVGVNLGIDRGFGITKKLYVPPTGLNPTEQLLHDRFDTDVAAVFGAVDYEFSDRLRGSLALRYDQEKRQATNLVPTAARSQYIDTNPSDGKFAGGAPLNPGLFPNINPSGVIAPQQKTFSELQPKLSLSWDTSTNTTAFASWGVGFKSGGFNNVGGAATVDIFINNVIDAQAAYGPGTSNVRINDIYEKETSSAFEAGFKGSLFDSRLNVELAGYYTQVDNMQFFEFVVGQFGLLRIVNSIDEVELYGGELSLNSAVTDTFSLNVGIAAVESEIKKFTSRPNTVGNKSPYTADYTLNLGAQYVQPLSGSLEFFGRIDYRLTGPTVFHAVQDQRVPTIFGADGDYTGIERDSFGIVNLRLGLQGEGWSLIAFADNLTDEMYLDEVIPAPEFGGSFIEPGNRRQTGVEFNYEF